MYRLLLLVSEEFLETLKWLTDGEQPTTCVLAYKNGDCPQLALLKMEVMFKKPRTCFIGRK